MKFQKKKKSLIIWILILLLPVCAFAEKIVFATTEVLPFVYQENGQWMGIDIELIREICKRHKLTPEFQELPWKRCLMYVEEGMVDGIFPLFQTKERTEFLYFSAEYIDTVTTVILARKGSGIRINHLDDLKGKTIIVADGFSYGPKFDNYAGLNKEKCPNMITQARMLRKGRTPLAIVPNPPFYFYLQATGVSR